MANIKLRRKGKNTKRCRSNMIEASELLTPECVASANSSKKYEKKRKKKCNCAEGKLSSVAFVKCHDMAII